MKFEGESPPPNFDALYHDHRLGEYTAQAPLYLLYIDNSYGYTPYCTTPVVTLEQPTVTGVNPSSVKINTTPTFTVSGGGFGPTATPGQVQMGIGGPFLNPISWTPNSATYSWPSGSTPGTVTVLVWNKKAARSNEGVKVTITNP